MPAEDAELIAKFVDNSKYWLRVQWDANGLSDAEKTAAETGGFGFTVTPTQADATAIPFNYTRGRLVDAMELPSGTEYVVLSGVTPVAGINSLFEMFAS